MFGEIAEALMDIAFSIFGFDIDIGNLGLTAKGLCDWTKISSSEFQSSYLRLHICYLIVP